MRAWHAASAALTPTYVYHILNRAVGRAALFDKPADYAAFEKVLRQS